MDYSPHTTVRCSRLARSVTDFPLAQPILRPMTYQPDEVLEIVADETDMEEVPLNAPLLLDSATCPDCNGTSGEGAESSELESPISWDATGVPVSVLPFNQSSGSMRRISTRHSAYDNLVEENMKLRARVGELEEVVQYQEDSMDAKYQEVMEGAIFLNDKREQLIEAKKEIAAEKAWLTLHSCNCYSERLESVEKTSELEARNKKLTIHIYNLEKAFRRSVQRNSSQTKEFESEIDDLMNENSELKHRLKSSKDEMAAFRNYVNAFVYRHRMMNIWNYELGAYSCESQDNVIADPTSQETASAGRKPPESTPRSDFDQDNNTTCTKPQNLEQDVPEVVLGTSSAKHGGKDLCCKTFINPDLPRDWGCIPADRTETQEHMMQVDLTHSAPPPLTAVTESTGSRASMPMSVNYPHPDRNSLSVASAGLPNDSMLETLRNQCEFLVVALSKAQELNAEMRIRFDADLARYEHYLTDVIKSDSNELVKDNNALRLQPRKLKQDDGGTAVRLEMDVTGRFRPASA